MDLFNYKRNLHNHGNSLSQVRRNQSDEIINATFESDPAYKRVYILTKDGWKFEDAKYQLHSTPTILKDAVDYYLQFRPKVHYPIGSYVFVPDDIEVQFNFSDSELSNPFSLQDDKITRFCWFIVGCDDSLSYVRHNILKCNWNFKWIYDGEIKTCWGANRSANSYTSGTWRDDISSSLDNLTSAWLPDIFYTYGNKLNELGLCDNRTIMHNQRFMLSNNILDPKVYQVTKIVDLSPSGIIKLSIKQDELNRDRDNIDLQICDYYNSEGENQISQPEPFNTSKYNTSKIICCTLNENNELIFDNINQNFTLALGQSSYYYVKFSDDNVISEWYVNLISDSDDISGKDRTYYEGLISITKFDNNVIAIKPAKANSLKGKKFELCVSDSNGDYFSSIVLEVSNHET